MNAVALQARGVDGRERVGPPRKPNALGMLAPDVGSLAMEVAARLEPLGTILQKYGLSKAQFAALMKNKVFRDAVVEAQSAFKSTANTPERIRIKAQLLTEAGLEDMYLILRSPNTPAAARVSAFAAIKTLTGLEKPEAPTHRQKFSLTINVASGSGTATRTIEAQAVEGEDYEAEDGEGAEPRHGLEGEDVRENDADGGERAQEQLRIATPVRIIGAQHPKLAKTYTWPGKGEGVGTDTAEGLGGGGVTSATGL